MTQKTPKDFLNRFKSVLWLHLSNSKFKLLFTYNISILNANIKLFNGIFSFLNGYILTEVQKIAKVISDMTPGFV